MSIMLMKVNPGLFSKTTQSWKKKNKKRKKNTKINVTTEGNRHFGAVVGSNDLWIKYVNEKAKEWASEFKVLPEFVKSQPQATYAAFCFAEQNKFSSLLWIIPEMNNLMRSVDEIVQKILLQASSVETISEKERILFSSLIRKLSYPII